MIDETNVGQIGTDKQHKYAAMLADRAGYAALRYAVAEALHITVTDVRRKRLNAGEASTVIDFLKAKVGEPVTPKPNPGNGSAQTAASQPAPAPAPVSAPGLISLTPEQHAHVIRAATEEAVKLCFLEVRKDLQGRCLDEAEQRVHGILGF
jgi:hypothetical protein